MPGSVDGNAEAIMGETLLIVALEANGALCIPLVMDLEIPGLNG